MKEKTRVENDETFKLKNKKYLNILNLVKRWILYYNLMLSLRRRMFRNKHTSEIADALPDETDKS